ncbi:MAG: DUF2974 domain-containing protein [Bacilli bacterium]|nr:DUF2974 domain-containing protein [Bacilli bacterium]
MNINAYIKKFGKYTFEEAPFNDIDSILFTQLVMMSFDYIEGFTGEICLKDITPEMITDKIFYDSPDRKFNRNQLTSMIESKRFCDLKIIEIKRIFSEEKFNQFYACTIVLPNGDLYIGFRGTDITATGWKEDFVIALKDTYLGQIQGLEYVRYIIHRYRDCNFYIGGHSKGGNIAFFATLHLTTYEASRLIKAYSFDGPGFRRPLEEFPAYKYVKDKMVKYLTYLNMIGSMFYGYKNYKVVHSTGILLGGHDVYYWQVSKKLDGFNLAKDVSPLSKTFSKRFMAWIDSLPQRDRELSAAAFFDVFRSCKTIYDIPTKAPIDLINAKKVLSNYTPEDQESLNRVMKQLVKYMIQYAKIKEENK